MERMLQALGTVLDGDNPKEVALYDAFYAMAKRVQELEKGFVPVPQVPMDFTGWVDKDGKVLS